jgi:hypothetical protein
MLSGDDQFVEPLNAGGRKGDQATHPVDAESDQRKYGVKAARALVAMIQIDLCPKNLPFTPSR